MTRKVLIILVGVCISVNCAQGGTSSKGNVPEGVSVLAETASGLYLITPVAPREEARAGKDKSQARGAVLATLNFGIFVRSATVATNRQDDAAKTMLAKLKARQNNVYALAVNSGGIARATCAVTEGGRVFLRAAPKAEAPPARLAAKDSESDAKK